MHASMWESYAHATNAKENINCDLQYICIYIATPNDPSTRANNSDNGNQLIVGGIIVNPEKTWPKINNTFVHNYVIIGPKRSTPLGPCTHMFQDPDSADHGTCDLTQMLCTLCNFYYVTRVNFIYWIISLRKLKSNYWRQKSNQTLTVDFRNINKERKLIKIFIKKKKHW